MKAEKGVTLIELVAAMTVLAVAVTGTMSVVQTAFLSDSMSREYAKAVEAAQAKIAEIRATSFGSIVATYTNPANQTFRVTFYEGQGQSMGIPVGGVPTDEGEVVVVRQESAVGANYGRDLDPLDGVPDGINLGTIWQNGLDLDAKGTIGGSVAAADLQLIPVYVIVRWRTLGRLQPNRVEMCTFIANR